MASEPTRFCDIFQTHLCQTEESATLSDKDTLAFGRLFEFGKLGTFLSALPASFAATRKASISACLSQASASSSHARVFELHEEHGLHVHLVTNQFIDVNRARELAAQAGWGRIHVTPMPSEHSGYLAKYLSKERPECLYRWRLWAAFGKRWEWTKVRDIIRETLFSRIYRACKEWKNWTGRGQFYDRMDLVRQMVILTIEHRWSVGCGPHGVPYGKCTSDF